MPTETLVWLGANVLLGLVTLFVALYVTRGPEVTDGAGRVDPGNDWPPPDTWQGPEVTDGAGRVDRPDAGQT